jgi:hypothetical protein
MESIGNARFNALSEARLGDSAIKIKPPPSASTDTKSHFIRRKYIDLEFASPTVTSLAGKSIPPSFDRQLTPKQCLSVIDFICFVNVDIHKQLSIQSPPPLDNEDLFEAFIADDENAQYDDCFNNAEHDLPPSLLRPNANRGSKLRDSMGSTRSGQSILIPTCTVSN